CVKFPIANTDAVEQNASLLHTVSPHEQTSDGRLAGAGVAHESYTLAERDLKGNILQHPVLFLVREPNILELDLAGRFTRLLRICGRRDLDLAIKKDEYPVRRYDGRLQHVELVRQIADRLK